MPTYKNPKTKKYYCKFYYVDWQGQRQQHKKEGFVLQRDAQQYERAFLEKEAKDCTITFAALVEHYYKYSEAHQRHSTYESKKSIIDKHLVPAFGPMPINKITTLTVERWQEEVITKKELAPTTLHQLQGKLSAVFNFAVKYYGLAFNPARRAGNIGTMRREKVTFWTVDEFNKAMKALQGMKIDAKYFAAYNLLFYSGIRHGELAALTVADFNAEAGTVRINKTRARTPAGFGITPPKTKKSNRIVTLPAAVVKMLQDQIGRLYEPQPGDTIFPHITYGLSDYLHKIAAAAGVKDIRVHDLRHSHASMLINLGFPPLLICERLGHEDITTTLRTYSHLYPGKENEVASSLQTLITTTPAPAATPKDKK